jgi:hypothetical protein
MRNSTGPASDSRGLASLGIFVLVGVVVLATNGLSSVSAGLQEQLLYVCLLALALAGGVGLGIAGVRRDGKRLWGVLGSILNGVALVGLALEAWIIWNFMSSF